MQLKNTLFYILIIPKFMIPKFMALHILLKIHTFKLSKYGILLQLNNNYLFVYLKKENKYIIRIYYLLTFENLCKVCIYTIIHIHTYIQISTILHGAQLSSLSIYVCIYLFAHVHFYLTQQTVGAGKITLICVLSVSKFPLSAVANKKYTTLLKLRTFWRPLRLISLKTRTQYVSL